MCLNNLWSSSWENNLRYVAIYIYTHSYDLLCAHALSILAISCNHSWSRNCSAVDHGKVDTFLLKTIRNGETSLFEINSWATWPKKLQVEADERVAQLERQLAQKELALAALEQEPWPLTTRYQCIRQWCVTTSEDSPGKFISLFEGSRSFSVIGAWDPYWSCRGSRCEIHRYAM